MAWALAPILRSRRAWGAGSSSAVGAGIAVSFDWGAGAEVLAVTVISPPEALRGRGSRTGWCGGWPTDAALGHPAQPRPPEGAVVVCAG